MKTFKEWWAEWSPDNFTRFIPEHRPSAHSTAEIAWNAASEEAQEVRTPRLTAGDVALAHQEAGPRYEQIAEALNEFLAKRS